MEGLLQPELLRVSQASRQSGHSGWYIRRQALMWLGLCYFVVHILVMILGATF